MLSHWRFHGHTQSRDFHKSRASSFVMVSTSASCARICAFKDSVRVKPVEFVDRRPGACILRMSEENQRRQGWIEFSSQNRRQYPGRHLLGARRMAVLEQRSQPAVPPSKPQDSNDFRPLLPAHAGVSLSIMKRTFNVSRRRCFRSRPASSSKHNANHLMIGFREFSTKSADRVARVLAHDPIEPQPVE